MDREKVIKGIETIREFFGFGLPSQSPVFEAYQNILTDVLALLKEQESTINELQNAYGYLQKEFFEAQDKLLKEQEETEWEHLWDAPDGTYKGRCKKCGFIHYFIESHDAQYTFCPSCGRSVKWE